MINTNTWFFAACMVTFMWTVVLGLPLIPFGVFFILLEFEFNVAALLWGLWHLIAWSVIFVWDRSENQQADQ